MEGDKEVAVEIFSMSKSYNMAGWRVGYCLGDPINGEFEIYTTADGGATWTGRLGNIIGSRLPQRGAPAGRP